MKFVYPPPRSGSAGIKAGPCGSQDFTYGSITELEPNSIVTLEIIETIHHRGAPYRIALSHVLDDTYSDCILLNHIPQHTQSALATLYIDIAIPNVNCSADNYCALQILSVMTDKIGQGNTCEYLPDGKSGSCFSNYHSCANVRINGDMDRDNLQCSQPSGWPYSDLTWNMYTQESSEEDWCLMNNNPLQLYLLTDMNSTCSTESPSPGGSTSNAPTVSPSGTVTIMRSSDTPTIIDGTMDTLYIRSTIDETLEETEEVSSSTINIDNDLNTTDIVGPAGNSIVGKFAKGFIVILMVLWVVM